MSGGVSLAAEGVSLVPGGVLLSTGPIPLSSAQLSALFSAPITIVAVPGVGKMVAVHRYVLSNRFGTVAYSGGGTVNLSYGSASGPAAVAGTGVNTCLTASSSEVSSSTGFALAGQPVAAVANQAVVLAQGTPNFTAGDSTAVLTIDYTIDDV